MCLSFDWHHRDREGVADQLFALKFWLRDLKYVLAEVTSALKESSAHKMSINFY